MGWGILRVVGEGGGGWGGFLGFGGGGVENY